MKKVNIEDIKKAQLYAGEEVLLSGIVYTARDAAHERLVKLIKAKKELPINLNGAVFYYAGPTATPPGAVCGSIGPTTSSRMDSFTPILIEHGLAGAIGKGQRSSDVIEAIRKYKAPYFAAIGGAGALYAKYIKKCEIIAFEELGCEAIRRLELCDFPAYVAVDIYGGNIFEHK